MTRNGLCVALLLCSSCDLAEPEAEVVEPALVDVCTETSSLAPGFTHPWSFFSYFQLSHQGVTRSFKVRVPAGYTGAEPVPLVFVSHALTQSGAQFGLLGSDMQAMADQGGFIAVFPSGRFGSWNGGGCCGQAPEQGVDDVGFFRAMLTYVRQDLGLCVDRTRVYATGLSAGAFMSYRLACEASDLFAAVASVAGGLSLPAADCDASQLRPVPLLQLHGTGDSIVDYTTGADSVAGWAERSGCEASTVPAAQPLSKLDTTCVTHTGCPDDVEVTLCSIADGGHCWFGNWTCGTGIPGGQIFVGKNARGIVAASAVWGFLSRFHCDECGL